MSHCSVWRCIELLRPTEFPRHVSLSKFLEEYGYAGRAFFIVEDQHGVKVQVPTSIDDLDKKIAGRFEMSTPLGVYNNDGAPSHVEIKTVSGHLMEITASYWHPTQKIFYVIFDSGKKKSCNLSVEEARAEIAKPPSKWRALLLR